MTVEEKGKAVGKGGYLLDEGGLILYLDPRDVEPPIPKADVICLSAVNPDNASERDVRRLAKGSTIVVGLPQSVSRFRLNQLPLLPGEKKAVLGIEIALLSASDTRAEFSLRYPDFEIRYPS